MAELLESDGLLDPNHSHGPVPAGLRSSKPLAGPLGDAAASPITRRSPQKAPLPKQEEPVIGSDKLREMIAREKELRR